MLNCLRGCGFPTDMVGVVSDTLKFCRLLELEDTERSGQEQAL